MAETSDIEKKSLEAHVELCAERYRSLDDRLDQVTEKMSNLERMVRTVHDMVHDMSARRNSQLINWGVGVIGALVGMIAWLVVNYALK